jgi:ribosomal protein L11 methyltransferase
MAWLELKLSLEGLDAERVEELLISAGALSVTLEDAGDEPIFEPSAEPSLWSHTRLSALFAADTDGDALRSVLLAGLGLATLPPHRLEPLEDRDWTREWLKDFKPMRFGRRLWVCPSGFTPPDPAGVNLLLDPGLAFGTGTHATTALCLEWLDEMDMAGRVAIDYGCGSGILAIAAARLGAERVWAVDQDPQALTATRANAVRNGVLDALRISSAAELPALRTNLLLANILAQPLMQLAGLFAQRVRAGGMAVLSGILDSQEQDIRHAYAPWFDLTSVAQREDWLRIIFVRNEN